MTLHPSTPTTFASSHRLALAILVAAAITVLLVLSMALLGVQANGPFYDIVPDPAGLSGLPF